MKTLVSASTMLLWLATTAQAQDYDFVIVGGGTAGCVLAARLCAGLPDAKIALLEAGTPRTAEQELIVRAPRNWADFTGGLIDRYVLSSAPIALIVGILASLFLWLL
jgi:choline dehydrogenase-like flavoprotein